MINSSDALGEAPSAQLVAAQRAGRMHHEVPYSLPDSRGVMDVVYQDAAGIWQVVDFKTDALPDDAALGSASSEYASQLRRYRAATEHLLGDSVAPMLCFLDVSGGVRWMLTN